MCLAQRPQCSDVGEARTCGPSVSSQALYHRAIALPKHDVTVTHAWLAGHSFLLKNNISCMGKEKIIHNEIHHTFNQKGDNLH